MAIYLTASVQAEIQEVEGLVADSVTDEAERRVRTRIVNEAMQAVLHGAHYLRGCYGATPDSEDPIRHRHVDYVNLGSLNDLALHAAHRDYRNLPFRCVGRCRNPNLGGSGGTGVLNPGAVRRELVPYLEQQQQRHGPNPVSWSPFGGRWPRRMLPTQPNGRRYVHPPYVARFQNQEFFLGEECWDKMHFDCTGFINWVLTGVGGRNTSYGIPSIKNAQVLGPVVPFNARNLVPGDLLIKDEGHIGIVGVNGHVIDAFGEDYGVVCRDHNHAGDDYWTDLCRLGQAAINNLDRPAQAPTVQRTE